MLAAIVFISCMLATYGSDCGCYSTTLIGQKPTGPAGFGSCYRYQINMCDTAVDTVVLGRAKAPKRCGRGIDISDLVISTQRRGVTYDLAYDETGAGGLRVRGVQVAGLMDGDTFRICFNASEVYGLIPGGNVEYQGMGMEVTCGVTDTLFDLCPDVGPSAALSVGGSVNEVGFNDEVKHVEEPKGDHNVKTVDPEEPMMIMTFVWSAVISAVVAMLVVFVAYITCIKPEMSTTIYEKVNNDKDFI